MLAGFRGIDTACQPKHYSEALVGEGYKDAINELGIGREQLFIQTKFTSMSGQDRSKPLPYDPNRSLETQVEQSIQTSLRNLQTDYLDSLVMHSPMRSMNDTLRVWKVMEKYVRNGTIRQIGVSNCYNLRRLERIYEEAEVKPKVVQNRFYSDTGFDYHIRRFCKEKGMRYQSFWTLTASRRQLRSSAMRKVAEELQLTPEETMYAFVRSLGIVPLNGTKSRTHMRGDLRVVERCGKDGSGIVKKAMQRKIAGILRVPVE